MRSLLCVLITLALAGSLHAQKSPKDSARVWLGLNCSIYAGADYDLTLSSTQPGETLPLDATYTNWVNLSTAVSPGNLRMQVYPGRLYTLAVSSTSWTTADLHFDVPAGYTLYLGHASTARTPATSYLADSTTMGATYTVTLELRPNDRATQLPVGHCLPPRIDDVIWALSLGFTSNGESAGTIRWRQSAVTTDLLNAVNLDYVDPVSDEVLVERDTDGALKYISSYQCQVRVFRPTDPTTGYTINFYQPDADPGTDRSFTGESPFASYDISSPASGTVRIIRTQDGPTEFWTLSVSGTTTTIAQLSNLSTGVREFEYVSAADTPTTGQRTVTVTTRYTGQGAAQVVQKIYQTFAWGEELVSETLDPGTGTHANLATTYTYHTSGWPTTGSAGKLATVTRPAGSWEKYDYSNDFAKWGQLTHVYRPWQDSPTSASSATTTNCHVTTLLYAGQRSVYQDIPSGAQTAINGTQTAETSASFSFGSQADYVASPYGAALRTDTVALKTSSSTTLTTTRKVFDTGIAAAGGGNPARPAHPLLAGRLYSQTNPDGTRVSAAYEIGNWVSYFVGSITAWDTYTFTPSGSGTWRIETYFNGNSTAVSGADSTPVTSWHGHTIEPVYLTPYRSTRRDVVTGLDGAIVQEIISVYTGSGAYKVIAWTHSDYAKGLLYNRIDSTGAREDRTYLAGRLASETHADGTQTQYTHDALYRVTRAQRTGVAATSGYPAQDAINTDYTYNAADQVLTTTTAPAGGGLSLATSATYNLAGQILTSVDERGLTTSFAYANGGRTVTATLPGGATRTTDRWLDGSAKSVTGTAVVPEHHQTTVDSTSGFLTAAVYSLRSSDLSSPTSAPRWSKVTTDWAGRKTKEERPAPPGASPSTFTKQYFFNASGQFIKTTETGLADTLMQYDAQGELQYTGLDLNANGSLDLAGTDRVTEVRSQVYNDTSAGVWYLRNRTYVYNQASSGTALLQSDAQTRLVPYPGNLSEFTARTVYTQARAYDIFGNLTVRTGTNYRTTRLGTLTTDLPDSSVDELVTTLNGLKVAHRSAQNLTRNSYYDALGRLVKETDPRTDTSTTARLGYHTSGTGAIGQLAWREDTAGNRTDYAYESSTGRLSTMTLPAPAGGGTRPVSRSAYTNRGELYRQWGNGTYPVEYAYNDYGERTSQSTYRGGTGWDGTTWPGSPGTADTTSWAFDPASGTLTSQTDAASRTVNYTYNPRNQLLTRQWARILSGTTPVTTTYGYSSTTAELTGVDYNDSTPDLTYTYNRLGQTATVADTTGTRTFNYSATTGQLQQEDLGSFIGSRSVTYTYDTAGSGTKGRLTNLATGLTSNPGNEYNIGYQYDTYGRMNQVWDMAYTYLANSNLISAITDTQTSWTQTRTYESNRDLLDVLETNWGAASKAKFDYASDNLGRRTVVAKTGEVYARYGANGLDTHYGYNPRSELESEVTKLGGTSTILTGREDGYTYDNIGNRLSRTHNGNAAAYTPNELNQYVQRVVPGVIDVTGLAPSAATVTVGGSSAGVTRHNDWYYKPESATNTSAAVWTSLAIASSYGGSDTRNAFLPLTPEPFTYDLDGNLLSDGRWDYTYDAENRLVTMQTRSTVLGPIPNAEARRLEFKYDYLGRRVQKTVRGGWNGTTYTTVVSDTKNLYNGWNLLHEFSVDGTTLTKVRSNIWGLDWSGTLQGAGGVGGLLYHNDVAAGVAMLPAYDGSGNVAALLKRSDSSGTMVAAYEYDAYGNTLRASGAHAASNPFRFSTKYTDTETGLVYHETRYYSPSLGRFITRDSIGEQGGINLYAYVSNRVPNAWDYLGMVNILSHNLTEEGDPGYNQSVGGWSPGAASVGYQGSLYTGPGTSLTQQLNDAIVNRANAITQITNWTNSVGLDATLNFDSSMVGGVTTQIGYVGSFSAPSGAFQAAPNASPDSGSAAGVAAANVNVQPKAPDIVLQSPESLSGLFNNGPTIDPVTGQLVMNQQFNIDARFNISPQGSTGSEVNWGQVGQGSLTMIGGVGGMIGGAALAGATAPTVAGAVVGATAMVAGATSFGLGMTMVANGFTGGGSVQTPTGTIPQGIVELVGAMTGNPNLQTFGGYGDVLLSTATPPRWGGPLAAGSAYIFRSDFDPNTWPFDL